MYVVGIRLLMSVMVVDCPVITSLMFRFFSTNSRGTPFLESKKLKPKNVSKTTMLFYDVARSSCIIPSEEHHAAFTIL